MSGGKNHDRSRRTLHRPALLESVTPHLNHGIVSEFDNVKAVTSAPVSAVLERRTCTLNPASSNPEPTRPVKAILCTRFGTADDLVFTDIDEPVAGPGEVVATVKAVGLNFYDTLIVAGRYQKQPPFPFSPGGEFAGVVESVGAGVSGFAPGDRVIGYVTYGAARERMAAPADKLIKLDGDLAFDRAAALTIIYGTAHACDCATARSSSAARRSRCSALPAASGSRRWNSASSWARGSSPAPRPTTSCAFARAHGADETVNYATEDLRDALKRLGGEHGIDVIFDPVGDRYSEAALRAIAWEGRHLVVGFAAGEIPKLPLNLTLLKGCAVLGVYFGDWVRREPKPIAIPLSSSRGLRRTASSPAMSTAPIRWRNSRRR